MTDETRSSKSWLQRAGVATAFAASLSSIGCRREALVPPTLTLPSSDGKAKITFPSSLGPTSGVNLGDSTNIAVTTGNLTSDSPSNTLYEVTVTPYDASIAPVSYEITPRNLQEGERLIKDAYQAALPHKAAISGEDHRSR